MCCVISHEGQWVAKGGNVVRQKGGQFLWKLVAITELVGIFLQAMLLLCVQTNCYSVVAILKPLF